MAETFDTLSFLNMLLFFCSSNANESLNTIIASKAPKLRFYGGTLSYGARLAFAINKQNGGE